MPGFGVGARPIGVGREHAPHIEGLELPKAAALRRAGGSPGIVFYEFGGGRTVPALASVTDPAAITADFVAKRSGADPRLPRREEPMPLTINFTEAGTYTIDDDGIRGNGTSVFATRAERWSSLPPSCRRDLVHADTRA